MSRIVHIALKCESRDALERAARLYEDVFGIYTTYNKHARGHLSQHMTDGNIDLALMLYDSENEKEAQLAGAGPRIHHVGIEVDDRPSMIARIEANGGSIFSDRAEGALKFFSPDGTLSEIVGVGRYQTKERSELARISHVTLHVNDVRKAKSFYIEVFGFEDVSRTDANGEQQVALSDGETILRMVQCPATQAPAIDCWGLEVASPRAAGEKVKQHGGEILQGSTDDVVLFQGPDGNKAEIIASAPVA